MAEVSHDGCIRRDARQKTASGVTVYLVEELSDARMRCFQLKRYLAEAGKLIQNSSHRDHIFEVAGHLLEGIPQAAFKLEKALDAVALAANHMDSEELKASLRPEKTNELEQVLKDVRIRQVQHRSEVTMNPQTAAQLLKEIAATVKETGQLPIDTTRDLVLALETGHKEASDHTATADHLEAMADAIMKPAEEGKGPSRVLLAQELRKLLGAYMPITADYALTSDQLQMADEAEVRKDFKKENPGISDADMDKIVQQWSKNKNVIKDKNKSAGDWKTADAKDWKAASEEEDAKRSRFEQGKPADPTENMSPEQAAQWKSENEKHKDKFKKKKEAEAAE